MAKAFYEKAQLEYENKNYDEAIKLLIKTKENLNGDTNPDIIFLEAKARFLNDININNSKALFEQFLNEADDSDSRIKEVSRILVDIETSNNYYTNGNRKTLELEDGKIFKIKYFNENGTKRLSEWYNGSEIQLRMYYDYVNGAHEIIAQLDLRGEIPVCYTKNGLVEKVYYYAKKPNRFNKVNHTFLSAEEHVQFNKTVELYFPDEQATVILFKYNGKTIQEIRYEKVEASSYVKNMKDYYALNIKVFKSFTNSEINEVICKAYESSEYNNIKINDYVTYHDNGMIKTMIDQIGNDYTKFIMNENGLPTRKEVYKKGNLKEVSKFNQSTSSWERLNKNDW
ncbi:hypothetical protein KH5_12190 [Urechidicola sp. KH5]